ncbi:MAG: hypothetical protein AB7T86_10130 [Xanthobacteraceae bacterium]|uniref:hypothetical protein n=1 Tax=Pseudolabrys sp. TaxID=1960880 RepID=UPI003D10F712
MAIDIEVAKKTQAKQSGFVRFVDDFALGAPTREDAERLRSILRQIVHSFELELNEEKTVVRSVVSLDYSSWRHEIRSFQPSISATKSKVELFLDKIIEISATNAEANCLRYALKQSRAFFVGTQEWGLIEDFLLLSYRSNPTVLPTIVEILVNRFREKAGDVDIDKVRSFIVASIPRLGEMEKHSEIAWLFFLALELSIKIPRNSLEIIFEQNNPVTALLACHLWSRSLIDKPIDRSQWNQSLVDSGLQSEMWLYAYEATLKGWTGLTAKKFITSSKEFAPLLAKKISFYDLDAHTETIATSVKKDIASSKKIKKASNEYLDEIDFEFFYDPDDELDIDFGFGY